MNRTIWIVIGAFCFIGLSGLIYITKKDAFNVDNVNPTTIVQSSDTVIGDNVYGNKNAKIVVFEYADFQCPGCGAAFSQTKKIQELYKEKVAFVFRSFPLTTIHPNAMAAAAVSEAAGLQGKYWEMHDLLFTSRDSWVNLSPSNRGSMFESLATQLNLNIDQFRTDLSSEKVQEKIQFDRAIAGKINVKSTPSFFIGTDQVDSATVDNVIQQQGDMLMNKIDDALRNAGETPPTRE